MPVSSNPVVVDLTDGETREEVFRRYVVSRTSVTLEICTGVGTSGFGSGPYPVGVFTTIRGRETRDSTVYPVADSDVQNPQRHSVLKNY